MVLFHIGFRTAALLVYIFCGWFSDGFIASFVFTIILLSLDFWTVKNITGRILVGINNFACKNLELLNEIASTFLFFNQIPIASYRWVYDGGIMWIVKGKAIGFMKPERFC